jgi:hypothetical protein
MLVVVVGLIVGLSVGACSVTKTVSHATVHEETKFHINENTTAFIELVNTIRLNSNVKKPSADLKNQINQLVFQAGLIPQCSKTDGCYLVRPGIDAKIRIESDHILLDFATSYVKIEDVSQAAQMIYG